MRLWDGPTRVVHWGLVIALGLCWWTGETGRLEWHRWSGYSALGLIVFRILWGFVGSTTSRFRAFFKGPRATLAYLRTLSSRAPSTTVGHNPLGALSIVAILASLIVQITAGLFAVDVDGFESGPLSYLVSFEQGRVAAKIHGVNFTILQILAALHVAAIIFYLVYKRTNLIGPMISGRRAFDAEPHLSFVRWPRVVLVAAIAVIVMISLSKGLRF
ncbi:cytochrome b/b6 domain-containing protein [Phenylobacterium immobile]|uniref:cytochrome b/b6 domain-containing protein n=1 Tax=Phenylobacterium immobile TaxID=21 RepID=UPI002480C382|nr:cytochrome b/b6 domain-containing protein [Phenylobacterium immobile]